MKYLVAVVAADEAEAALALMRALPAARDAAIVGYVREQPQRLVLRTVLGGERVIEELEDDPLPRIC
jgi:hydrogenase expression/formation protein HypE